MHPFGKKKKFGAPSPFLHTSALSPLRCAHTSRNRSLHLRRFCFLFPLDLQSPLALRLKIFFCFVFCLNQKLLLGFVRVWSRDLEMKTDLPLICRIWIGIACASGEQTFYCENLGAQKLMNANRGVDLKRSFAGSFLWML